MSHGPRLHRALNSSSRSSSFLDVVDFSIVQVALPAMRTEFLVSLAEIQWIAAAYGLTMAGFLLLDGRAGDLYGQMKLFIVGVAVFTVASLTAGLAPSLLVLVASRRVQGVGAAISSLTALSILVATFPEGRERNGALGIFVAVLSAGLAAGSIAGGVLTAMFGWRSVFFVSVPIGIAAVVLSRRFLPNNTGRTLDRRLDLPGALSVTSGLVLLVYALTNAANEGLFSLQTTLPLSLSALVLAGFFAIEYRPEAPLMPLGFLHRSTVLTANVLALIFAASASGLGFIVTIYLQQILGYSALSTDLGFLPPAIIFFVIGGWGSSWLVNKFTLKPVLVASTALATVGSALLTQTSVNGNYLGIVPGMVIWALGASIGFPALNIAGLAGTRPGEEGLASGILSTSARLGFPLGLAILLTVASITNSSSPGVSVSSSAVVIGFQHAFIVSAVLSGIGLLISLLISTGKPPKSGPVF